MYTPAQEKQIIQTNNNSLNNNSTSNVDISTNKSIFDILGSSPKQSGPTSFINVSSVIQKIEERTKENKSMNETAEQLGKDLSTEELLELLKSRLANKDLAISIKNIENQKNTSNLNSSPLTNTNVTSSKNNIDSLILGVDSSYLDPEISNLSSKNQLATEVITQMRNEQIKDKMTLMEQQLSMKQILEERLKSEQLNKIKIKQLIDNYQQQLLQLTQNYQQRINSMTQQNIPSVSLASRFIDTRPLSPLVLESLENVSSPFGNIKLDLSSMANQTNGSLLSSLNSTLTNSNMLTVQNNNRKIPISNSSSISSVRTLPNGMLSPDDLVKSIYGDSSKASPSSLAQSMPYSLSSGSLISSSLQNQANQINALSVPASIQNSSSLVTSNIPQRFALQLSEPLVNRNNNLFSSARNIKLSSTSQRNIPRLPLRVTQDTAELLKSQNFGTISPSMNSVNIQPSNSQQINLLKKNVSTSSAPISISGLQTRSIKKNSPKKLNSSLAGVSR